MKHLFFIYLSKAKEKHIADETDYSRMIGAKNLEEAFKILQDTNYASYALNRKAVDYEEVIEEEKKIFREELVKMGAKEEILEVITLNEENISFIIKKTKSKSAALFLKEYNKMMVDFVSELEKDNLEVAKKIEKDMKELEKEFIRKSEMKSEGLSPFLAFCLKRKKAEKIVRMILSSKKIGIPDLQINNLITNIKAI